MKDKEKIENSKESPTKKFMNKIEIKKKNSKRNTKIEKNKKTFKNFFNILQINHPCQESET